jgi:hypothetical protein
VNQAGSPGATGRNLAYQQFWARFLHLAHSERPGWNTAREPPAQNWTGLPVGVAGFHYSVGFSRQGLRSELYFGREAAINKRALDELLANEDALDSSYGGRLTFERLPGRKACRVADYHTGHIDQASDWDVYLYWFLDSQTRLRKAIDDIGGMSNLYRRATT